MLTMDGVGQKRVHFAVPEGYPITSGTFGKTGMPPQPSTGLRTRNAMLRFSSRRQGKKPALASWYSPVAQLVEQRTVNPRVPGSSPGGGASTHGLVPTAPDQRQERQFLLNVGGRVAMWRMPAVLPAVTGLLICLAMRPASEIGRAHV